MGNNGLNFNIEADGTINRRSESSENTSSEKMYLNIIRVASQDDNILSAYRARKKCYKLCKKSGRPDYKEHIQQLQLDYYPDEFKKSLLGAEYILNLCLIIGCAIQLLGYLTLILCFLFDHYASDYVLWLILGLLISVGSIVWIRSLIPKVLNLKQEIKSLSK